MADVETKDHEVVQEASPPNPEPAVVDPCIAELSALKATLASRDARIAELEGQVTALEQRAREWETKYQETQRQLEEVQQAVRDAVDKYRTALLASAPEVPEELVQGETVPQVEDSFAQARQVVERIRNRLEASLAKERVPIGSPTRRAPDLSALSPREKIAYALTRR